MTLVRVLSPRSLASLLALLPLTAAAAAPPDETPAILRTLRDIETGVLKGNGDQLRQQYEEQVKAAPTSVLPKVYLAWCGIPSEDAWNSLKLLSAKSPEMPWPRLGMGRIYLAWKLPSQAEAEFRRALGKTPNLFFPAAIGLADVARATGKLDVAEATYRDALALADDPAAHGGLGLTLLALGKTADAKAELQRAVDGWPDQPEVLAALADLLLQEKDSAGALKLYQRSLTLAPKDRKARRAVADLAFDSGDRPTAAAEYLRLLEDGETDPEVFKRMGGLLDQLQSSAGAERYLLKVADQDKTATEPLVQLAEIAIARNDLGKAEARLRSALERNPADPALHLRLARLLLKQDSYRDALESFRAAAAAGDKSPELAAETAQLAARLMLPAAPAKGSLDQIYAKVSASLNALYATRAKENPDLAGTLKIKVQVGGDGKVEAVDLVEDSVNDPLIAAHAYFALKDAKFPAKRREPTFEFELK